MMNKLAIYGLLLLLCFTATLYAQNFYNNYGDAVLLEQIRALTFSRGQMTTGRRSAPVQQLTCVGGGAQTHPEYFPSVVQCTNVGNDDSGNAQWDCKADLDSRVRFEQTIVNCEGYSNPDDPYILKGSCGLEYRLGFTEQGRQSNVHSGYTNNYNNQYYQQDTSDSSFGKVFIFLVFAFIIIALMRQCNQNAATSYASAPPSYASAPGGYYNPTNDPPPSYPGYPKPYPDNTYAAPGTTWRPGFWTGFGTGGLMSYLFRPRAPGYYTAPNYGQRTGSWGSSGSFGSSSPRTANAFASTRRR